MKSTIKAVLFDLDDTLWAIDPVIARAEQVLYEWLRRYTPAVADDRFIPTFRARQKRLIKAHPRYGYALWELRHACLVEAFEEAGIITFKFHWLPRILASQNPNPAFFMRPVTR